MVTNRLGTLTQANKVIEFLLLVKVKKYLYLKTSKYNSNYLSHVFDLLNYVPQVTDTTSKHEGSTVDFILFGNLKYEKLHSMILNQFSV